MKVLFCVLMVGLFVVNGMSQTISLNLPVGEDSLIYAPQTGDIIVLCDCHNTQDGECKYYLNGPKNIFPPFYEISSIVGIKTDTVSHYFDTVSLTYEFQDMLCSTRFGCFNPPCMTHIVYQTIEVNAYYDDKVKVIPYLSDVSRMIDRSSSDVVFVYDTSSKKYASGIIPVEIYNNKNTSAVFTDWVLSFDSSQSLSFTFEQDSVQVTSVFVDSTKFIKNLLFLFSSSLTPATYLRLFAGKVQCQAHFTGKDSICTVPLRFIFQAVPKMGVLLSTDKSNSLEVYPNPSSASVEAICSIRKPSFLRLYVYNELGKDVMIVYNGVTHEGYRDFPFKLSQGIYYVRMETAEGVVSKKVVVE